MQARAWLPALVLLALPLAAAASYGGTQVTVDAPATIDGRVDHSLPGGIASFVGDGAAPFVVILSADELAVTVRTLESRCAMSPLPGTSPACELSQPEDEDLLLSDARLTLKRTLSAYKVVVTTDRSYADTATFGETGRLLATSGATTQLGANKEARHLSGSEAAWTEGDGEPLFEPVYMADARSAEIGSPNAYLRAIGGFETFLQGFEVRLQGTTQDGEAVDRLIDTRTPGNPGDAYRVVVAEAHEGDLSASGSAPFLAYAPADQAPASDVHDRVRFTAASGTVVEDGEPRAIQGTEDLTLTGPLHLRLEAVGEFEQPRLQYTVLEGLQLDGVTDDPTDAPLPPGALAAAGAAGAGGAGLLLALAWFWPRLKYALTLALLPMYTRIERDAVLEHEKRDELYELIRATPGIHAHEIGEKARIGWGTTVYHLKLLENHGLIVSKKSGRYKRFFVNTGEYTKKKDVYGALRNETAKAVADYIVNNPGRTQKELCAALNIQPSLASWHVEKLEGVELVKRVKDGRMVRYFAGPAWQMLGPTPQADVEGGAAS